MTQEFPSTFPGRAGMLQRIVPTYRVPVYDTLAVRCGGGLGVCTGRPDQAEAAQIAENLEHAQLVLIKNHRLIGGPLELVWQSGVLDWLNEWQPDALVVDGNSRVLSTRLVRMWMQKRNRPILAWGLGTMIIARGFEKLRAQGRNRFLRKFDGMIAYSTRAAEEYAAIGIPEDRIFVARNACTFRPTQPPPVREDSFSDQPRLLFVGRMLDGKRLDILFHACAELPAEIKPSLRLVGDGPALAEYQAIAADVYPEAEFTGGLWGDELAAEFAAADLFVLPGLGGLAVQEAMAHALPVVVAEADGTQADLVRPDTGWMVPPGDVPVLRNTLVEALSDVARLRSMGAESYRVVLEEINIETMVDGFIHALNAVTKNSLSRDSK